MKAYTYFVVIIALLSLNSFPVQASDTKGEPGQGSERSHDHGTWKEKRFAATVDADGVQRVEIVGGEYYYNPNYIVVRVNKPVELKLKKASGYIPHNLIAKAPEAGIEFNLDLKSDFQTVKFTPNKTGKYPMYCDKSLLWFKTHKEKGMEGIIEVIE
jgi:plastocyanin